MSYYTDETKEERHIECLEVEVERLRALNKRTYCAYCGFSVLLLEDPDAKERVLDHIKSCEYHPLGQENARLREALREIYCRADIQADEPIYELAEAALSETDLNWLIRHDAEVRREERERCVSRVPVAVLRIIHDDLTDRRGLKHEWRQVDADIQTEIINAWADIVATAIREGGHD